MSKYQLKKSDIYYPQSNIAINKLDIRDKKTLDILEKELLSDATKLFVSELNEDTQFNESYFKSLHQRTFSSLYSWAGVYRNFDMAKGDSMFCRGEFVESESKKIFERLAQEGYLRHGKEMPLKTFAQKIADYQCELIALHPFYELNGRITRLFFNLIAIYNGYAPVDYSLSTPEEYIDASISCVQFADSSHLAKIIENGLQRL